MAEPYFKTKQADDGQWYFVFIGGNGEIQFTSELYPTESNAKRGIVDVTNAEGRWKA